MDTLDLIMIIALAMAFGFYIGWVARGVVIITNLARDPDRMMKMLQEIKNINREEAEGIAAIDAKANSQARINGVELAIERVNNRLYAYAKDTNQFVAQGSTLEELLKEAHTRFPGKTFFGEIDADEPAKDLAS